MVISSHRTEMAQLRGVSWGLQERMGSVERFSSSKVHQECLGRASMLSWGAVSSWYVCLDYMLLKVASLERSHCASSAACLL